LNLVEELFGKNLEVWKLIVIHKFTSIEKKKRPFISQAKIIPINGTSTYSDFLTLIIQIRTLFIIYYEKLRFDLTLNKTNLSV